MQHQQVFIASDDVVNFSRHRHFQHDVIFRVTAGCDTMLRHNRLPAQQDERQDSLHAIVGQMVLVTDAWQARLHSTERREPPIHRHHDATHKRGGR